MMMIYDLFYLLIFFPPLIVCFVKNTEKCVAGHAATVQRMFGASPQGPVCYCILRIVCDHTMSSVHQLTWLCSPEPFSHLSHSPAAECQLSLHKMLPQLNMQTSKYEIKLHD